MLDIELKNSTELKSAHPFRVASLTAFLCRIRCVTWYDLVELTVLKELIGDMRLVAIKEKQSMGPLDSPILSH